MKLIVQNALRLYSQDRTGLVDYALESGGMEKLMSTLLPVYNRAFLACRDKQAGCSVPQLCAPMCLLYNERAGIKSRSSGSIVLWVTELCVDLYGNVTFMVW